MTAGNIYITIPWKLLFIFLFLLFYIYAIISEHIYHHFMFNK